MKKQSIKMSFKSGVCCVRTFVMLLGFLVLPLEALAQVVEGRDFSVDGFAAIEGNAGTNHYLQGATTGGAAGKVVYAKTFQQLQAYMQAVDPYVILVDHDMDTGIKCYIDDSSTGALCGVQDGSVGVETTYGERIMVASNKTLIGVVNPTTGKAPLFSRITFVMQCASNVIIRNCRFTMKGVPVLKSGENKIVAYRNGSQIQVGDPDCISMQADKNSASKDWGGHVWIDHCEFFNGDAANKDRYDGLIDCKNNVQWITISYNHFHDHDKSCLFGKGDSDVFDGCRTITMHHNFFEHINGSRLPLQRGGHLHYANNYMLGAQDGWDLRSKSVGYAEACYFESSKAPILPDGGGSLNINKTEGYDLYYTGCLRLISGYTNADNGKIDATYDVVSTDWVPTATAADYKLNNLDKTLDVPGVIEKYTGSGKIEIFKAYTDAVPEENIDEYAKAVKNQTTGNYVWGPDGNKITNVSTDIQSVEDITEFKEAYFSLDGKEIKAPMKGINLLKKTDSKGKISVEKILIR